MHFTELQGGKCLTSAIAQIQGAFGGSWQGLQFQHPILYLEKVTLFSCIQLRSYLNQEVQEI